jgi:hypothetical protein
MLCVLLIWFSLLGGIGERIEGRRLLGAVLSISLLKIMGELFLFIIYIGEFMTDLTFSWRDLTDRENPEFI